MSSGPAGGGRLPPVLARTPVIAALFVGCSGDDGTVEQGAIGDVADDDDAPGGDADVGRAGEGEGEPPSNLPAAAPPATPEMADWECPPGGVPTPVGVGEPWEFTACPLPLSPPREIGGPCPQTADGFPTEAALRSAAPGYEGDIHYAGAGRDWGPAYNRAEPGDIIALGPGQHVVGRILEKDVALVGACASGTRIPGLYVRGPAWVADLSVNASQTVAVVAQNLGGRLTLERIVIEAADAEGLLVLGESSDVVANDLAVRQVRLSADGLLGFCVHAAEGGRLTGERLDLQDCGIAGVAAGGSSTIHLTDLAVRGVRGATADDGSRLVIERATFEGVMEFAIASLTTADDLLPPRIEVSDVRVSATDHTLVALVASDRGRLKARRVWVEGPAEVGLGVELDGTLEIEDAVVSAPRRRVLSVERGGSLTADRVYGAAWASQAGITVIGAGTADAPARLTDIVLLDGEGRGLDLQASEAVVLERVLVGRVRDVAVLASEATVLIYDLTVHDMRSDERVAGGHALIVQEGASVDGRRVRVERARDAAIFAFGEAGRTTTMKLTDLAVLDTLQAECAELPADNHLACTYDGGTNEGAGNAVMSLAGARSTLRNFEVRGAALAGVVVARQGELDLQRGVITGATLGVNVLVDDYDLERLSDEVYVFGNGTDFAREELLLPAPAVRVP